MNNQGKLARAAVLLCGAALFCGAAFLSGAPLHAQQANRWQIGPFTRPASAEGLVYFHARWFLNYGCADSLVAMATAPAK